LEEARQMSVEPHDPGPAEALEAVLSHASAYLRALGTTRVAAAADLETLRGRIRKPLGTGSLPAKQVIEDLIADVGEGLHATAGGRFFGWVIGGALHSALAADWLTSAWDQNAHNYATAPAAAVVEEVVGEWLKELLSLPRHASFALVTGCQMAHATCLAAARHALLGKMQWDVGRQGLYSAPPIRVLSSDQLLGSTIRALRLLGMGESHLNAIPCDADGRLRPDALELALADALGAPTLVVLQAGDLNIGAFDPFETLIPVARKYDAWIHIDGAFGLWAAASPRYRHLLKGAELADSWATDGHKWLNVPQDCGYAFVADTASHVRAMTHRASYISYSAAARDQVDFNPEWSRRARGFATYAAIRELGREGIASLVERCCSHAHRLVVGIGRLPGAELLHEPRINQGLVRFTDPRPGASGADHDCRTEQVISRIASQGEAFFTGTTWRGVRAMRINVCNWRTSDDDIARSIDAVAKALGSQAEGG
jgi:glutamate/tyrosine decarboxylase-like PLP-dependent enzyme